MTREDYEKREKEIEKYVKGSTNEENLRRLPLRELAWFIRNYSDSCRTCVYKDNRNCPHDETRKSCHEYTVEWLSRMTKNNDDDMFMFVASRQNVLTDEYNKEVEKWNDSIRID